MISSKAMGWMLIMGIIAFAIMTLSWAIQGNQNGTAETVAWAAASSDWENVGMVRMLGLFLMTVFMTGFISWARSINNSSSAIAIGSNFALFSVLLLWVGLICSLAGYDTASDNTSAAFGLIKLGNIASWFSGTLVGLSFFLIGLSSYRQKVGVPTLTGLLAIMGLAATVGNFILFWVWIGAFGLGMLILAIIGLQKIKGD